MLLGSGLNQTREKPCGVCAGRWRRCAGLPGVEQMAAAARRQSALCVTAARSRRSAAPGLRALERGQTAAFGTRC